MSGRPASLGAVSGATVVRETAVPGAVPRYEIPGWRERFGVVAGITGRGSGDPFDLGLWTDQPVRTVMERWRLLRAVEPGFYGTVVANQVHETEVAWHRDAHGWVLLDRFDGHGTGRAGLLLTVTVADCIPIYLVDPESRVVVLLHAGWRGIAGGIVARGVEQAVAHGAGIDRLVLHCGVGICGECYEVGSEVLAGCGVPANGAGRCHLDLRQVVVTQAQALGIGQLSRSGWCSAHDAEFFSHRRSHGADGRMVAYFGILP